MKCYTLATHGKIRMDSLLRKINDCKLHALSSSSPETSNLSSPLHSLHWAKTTESNLYGLFIVGRIDSPEGQKIKKMAVCFLADSNTTDDVQNVKLLVKVAKQVAYDVKHGMITYDNHWKRKLRLDKVKKAA